MIANLKDTLNKNLELRLKHRDDPEQFLDSEAEVHIALKQIQSISAYPQHVGDFIQSAGVDALIEVLDHPNPDISIESVVLLTELTDEDLLAQVPQARKVVDILVRSLSLTKFYRYQMRCGTL